MNKAKPVKVTIYLSKKIEGALFGRTSSGNGHILRRPENPDNPVAEAYFARVSKYVSRNGNKGVKAHILIYEGGAELLPPPEFIEENFIDQTDSELEVITHNSIPDIQTQNLRPSDDKKPARITYIQLYLPDQRENMYFMKHRARER